MAYKKKPTLSWTWFYASWRFANYMLIFDGFSTSSTLYATYTPSSIKPYPHFLLKPHPHLTPSPPLPLMVPLYRRATCNILIWWLCSLSSFTYTLGKLPKRSLPSHIAIRKTHLILKFYNLNSRKEDALFCYE